jgi:hypothetical protein
MEWEGKVAHARPHCAVSGRPLTPSEVFFSALRFADGQFVRSDYAADAWPTAPRDGVLSWWRNRMPDAEGGPRIKLDAGVLRQIFFDLRDAEDRPQRCFRFVVALCLVRIKAFRFIAVDNRAEGAWVVLTDRADGQEHRVSDPAMSAEEQVLVQQDLSRVVGA